MSARGAVIRRRPLSLPRPRAVSLAPRVRRRLVVIVAVLGLAFAGYMLWLRDSSLVAVKDVTVTGVRGADAGDVRRALESAAGDMTTLHLRRDRLERAVARFPVVGGLELSPDFPNGLHIRVLERRPAALVVGGGSRSVVAGDGTILTGTEAAGGLPTIRVDRRQAGRRLSDPTALAAARVAAGAPAALGRRLTAVRHTRDRGIVVETEGGPDLVFGDAVRVAAKWIAATRVLADRASEGATYIDLRLPERPAAGGLPRGPAPSEPAPTDPQPGAGAGAAAEGPQATPQGTVPAPPAAPAAPVPAQPQPPPATPQGTAAPPASNPQL